MLFLAFGSNLGDREKNISEAYGKITERIGEIVSRSVFYVTRPEGFQSENLFFNSVCKVETGKDIHSVFKIVNNIEKELGRLSKSNGGNYSDRPIDIDILLYDNLILHEPDLTIPHPLFHLRRFVLEPMAEIAPEIVHPVLGETIGWLRLQLADGEEYVRK